MSAAQYLEFYRKAKQADSARIAALPKTESLDVYVSESDRRADQLYYQFKCARDDAA